MSHFIHKKCYILLGSLVLVSGLCALFYFTAPRTRYEAAAMTENSEILNNPYCGFYHLYGYLLSEEGRKPARQWCENMLANDSQSILLLQINLRHYSNKSISSSALDQLDTILVLTDSLLSAFSTTGMAMPSRRSLPVRIRSCPT